ncbi:MAG: alpha-galactosidase [Clostridiales bacterium]|nr:alpha-galactosidase [Clostridiales bacterium]
MKIYYYEDQKTWVLSTQNVDYALGVDRFGRLQHLYWGKSLKGIHDFPKADDLRVYCFESPKGYSREEIMPWGGLKYTEPGLKVTFANHTRDLDLVYDHFQIIGDAELVVSLKDKSQLFSIHLHYRVIENYDIIERYVEIRNEGTMPVKLEQVMGAIWHFPVFSDYRLTYLAGHWAAELQVRQELLQEGKKVIESRHGSTGHYFNPWFAIDTGTGNEEYGEIYYGAVAFSGNWKIVIEKTPFQTLQVAAGLNDFDFLWELEPSQSFTSPVCIGGYSDCGFGKASRNMHHYQQELIRPSLNELNPVLYNSWNATIFDVNEKDQKSLAEKAAALGVELFVIDDGWFGQRYDDKAGLGNWYVNREKFPDGLAPLIKHVRELGMKFGIWVEPEMVNPDSDLYRKHPDWVYHFPDRERSEFRNQLVLNLGREDVKQFILDMMDELMSDNDISFVKWDMNRYFSEPGWPEAPASKHKEVWIRHVEGLYEIWRILNEKYPKVTFESCSGGGGRIDLGIMRYADQFWVSDNCNAFDRLQINEGYTYAYHAKAMASWVVDGPWKSFKYRFHCAMMGALGIAMNLNKLTEEELDATRQFIQQYKEISATVQEGDLYRLLSPRSSMGAVVQYVNKVKTQAVVFAFRHIYQLSLYLPPIRLKGLDPEGEYFSETLNITRSGASLMNRGIEIKLNENFSSQLIVFQMSH